MAALLLISGGMWNEEEEDLRERDSGDDTMMVDDGWQKSGGLLVGCGGWQYEGKDNGSIVTHHVCHHAFVSRIHGYNLGVLVNMFYPYTPIRGPWSDKCMEMTKKINSIPYEGLIDTL